MGNSRNSFGGRWIHAAPNPAFLTPHPNSTSLHPLHSPRTGTLNVQVPKNGGTLNVQVHLCCSISEFDRASLPAILGTLTCGGMLGTLIDVSVALLWRDTHRCCGMALEHAWGTRDWGERLGRWWFEPRRGSFGAGTNRRVNVSPPTERKNRSRI